MSPRVRDGQTSPSMHVKPDTPPTARHGESWNVVPAVCPCQDGDDWCCERR